MNIAIFTILLLIIGYVSYTMYNKNITQDKASKVAINHMKDKENIDLVVTKVEILHGVRDGFIDVEGYSKMIRKGNPRYDKQNAKLFSLRLGI